MWNKYGGGVTTGAQGAGLSLAILEVLYNAGPGGTIIPNYGGNQYAPNFSGDPTAMSWYNTYLTDFTTAGSSVSSPASYGIFVPDNNNPGPNGLSGQEFIFLAPGPAPSTVVVPEPTTLISGALMLAPFGASLKRVLRRKQAA
jgi:hypothetical protein